MLLAMEAEAKDSPPLDTMMVSFFMFLSLVSSILNVLLVHLGAKKQAKLYSQIRVDVPVEFCTRVRGGVREREGCVWERGEGVN